MKVFVNSPWADRVIEEVGREFPEIKMETAQEKAEILERVKDAEVIYGRIDRDIFLAAKEVRWIQSQGAGVENMVTVPELVASDVTLTNTRGAHAITIAEHTFGMLVALARDFPSLFEAQKEKVYFNDFSRYPVGLAGLTMGIIGLGNIGRAIAKRAHAFDMRVIALDAHAVEYPDYVVEFWQIDGLPELLRQADVVVITVPITPQTRGMIGAEQLALMKPDAYLLAVSRGGIVDEAALIEALETGRLAGAGLDVQAIEPLPADDPLWDAPNLILTPHCSGRSSTTTAAAIGIFRDNLRRYQRGEPLHNLVNKELGY